MARLVGKLLITALALLLTAYALPGVFVASFYIALIVAVILGFVNLILKPILVLFTLPINILTLGLFMFIINGFLFWFVASFVDGFDVDGFWWAVLGALVVSAVSYIGNKALDKIDD